MKKVNILLALIGTIALATLSACGGPGVTIDDHSAPNVNNPYAPPDAPATHGDDVVEITMPLANSTTVASAASIFTPKNIVVPPATNVYGHGSLFNPGNYNYFLAGTDLTANVSGGGITVNGNVVVGRWYDFNFRIGNRWADVRTISVNGVSSTTACRSIPNPTPAPYAVDYTVAPLIAFRVNRSMAGVSSIEFSSVCNIALENITIRVTGDSNPGVSMDEPDLPWAGSPQITYQTSLEWDGTTNPTTAVNPVAGVASVTYQGVLVGVPSWHVENRIDPNPFAPPNSMVLSMGNYVDVVGAANCSEELTSVLNLAVAPAAPFYAYVVNGGFDSAAGCAIQPAGLSASGPDTDNRLIAYTLR